MTTTSSGLIEGARRQDSSAWSRLVRFYSPLVYHWCRHNAELRPEDAADVLQEVFTAVARSIQNFKKEDEQGSFRGWLRVITSNKIKDWRNRNEKQTPATGGSDAARIIQQVPDLLPKLPADEALSSSEQLCEQALIINRLLEELRPLFNQRSWKAFWQSELAGRPRCEIAEEFGMSIDAVNMAIYRIRKRLREELEGFQK